MVGLYSALMNYKENAIKEGFSHPILMILPRPLSPSQLFFIAQEIEVFVSWAQSLIGVNPSVEVI